MEWCKREHLRGVVRFEVGSETGDWGGAARIGLEVGICRWKDEVD